MKPHPFHRGTKLAFLAVVLSFALGCAGSALARQAPETWARPPDTEVAPPGVLTSVVGIELRERGALLGDEFAGDAIDTSKWEIWHNDPERASFAIKDGRFEIRAFKSLGHNGLSSLHPSRIKDVTLVARMNVESKGRSRHDLLLHLCGGDMPTSPDHWVEIAMRDLGDGKAGFSVDAGVESGVFARLPGEMVLERKRDDGFLARLSLDGSRNLAKTEVRDHDGAWHEIVEPIPLRLRTTHAELKMRGGYLRRKGLRPSPSLGWFENVRMYPRAASHPALFRLVRRDGTAIYSYEDGPWPPSLRIGDDQLASLEDLLVELWTADGETLISSTRSAYSLGHYMLPVDHGVWDVFPVGALLRISVAGTPLGEVRIPEDRLFPDDVYDVFLE